MKLGLVCISEILKAERGSAGRTMSRSSFLKGDRLASIRTLSSRILENVRVLHSTILSCSRHGISHYRVSSSIFPLLTDPVLELSYDDLPDLPEILRGLADAGAAARGLGISLSSHPDQFNVLASYNPETVRATIRELDHQSRVLDWLGCSQDLSSPMCLHLNKSPDLKTEDVATYRERFLQNLSLCSAGVQARLVLENEDKGYWNAANLYRLFSKDRALVYDNLHDLCNPSGDGFANLYVETWGSFRPVFHWSEGKPNAPRSHAARASHIPSIVQELAESVTWEVELKDKDYAILDIFKINKSKHDTSIAS